MHAANPPLNTAGPSYVAREAERMAQNSSGKQAMLLNHIAIGCMVAMALPAVLQAFEAIFHTPDRLTHVQRLKMQEVGRQIDERSKWGGDRRR